MAQLKIYLSEELARLLRRAARRKGCSVSQYVANILATRLANKGWRRDFFTHVVGGWKGAFPALQRPRPETPDPSAPTTS
jgi:hypothetical protein